MHIHVELGKHGPFGKDELSFHILFKERVGEGLAETIQEARR
jgi:hypothetical protein